MIESERGSKPEDTPQKQPSTAPYAFSEIPEVGNTHAITGAYAAPEVVFTEEAPASLPSLIAALPEVESRESITGAYVGTKAVFTKNLLRESSSPVSDATLSVGLITPVEIRPSMLAFDLNEIEGRTYLPLFGDIIIRHPAAARSDVLNEIYDYGITRAASLTKIDAVRVLASIARSYPSLLEGDRQTGEKYGFIIEARDDEKPNDPLKNYFLTLSDTGEGAVIGTTAYLDDRAVYQERGGKNPTKYKDKNHVVIFDKERAKEESGEITWVPVSLVA